MIPPMQLGGVMPARIRRGVVLVLAGLFGYLVFCEFFFITHATQGLYRHLASLVMIPAAVADHRSVSYKEVVELANGISIFAGVENHKDAFDQALKLSVHRLYIKQLANELDVQVTQAELEAYTLDLQELAPDLAAAHWQANDYQKYIVAPLLLAQKTQTAVSAHAEYQVEVHKSMESVRKKLAQGMPLADAAQHFSQDSSAASRGDLGIMSLGTLPAWLVSAATLEPGQLSPVLEAPEALWVVTVLEFYPSEIPEQAAVHFQGLAIKKKTFQAVLAEQESKQPVWVFVW